MAGERYPYIGKLGGNLDFPAIPIQAEATAYLGRFTGSITPAYKNALNQLIFTLKQAGLWSAIQDLWLFAAPTQADALRNLISAARDATLIGTPTYSATAGFTVTSANKVSMPFSTSGVGTASGCVYAGRLGSGLGAAQSLVGGTAGAALNVAYRTSPVGGVGLCGYTGVVCPVLAADGVAIVGGHSISANGYPLGQGTSSSGTVPGSTEASPIVASDGGSGATVRILGYGVMPTGLTTAQYRKVTQAMLVFFEALGAVTP